MCLGDLIFSGFREIEIAVNDGVLVCDCEIPVAGGTSLFSNRKPKREPRGGL